MPPPPHDETPCLPTHCFCWRGVINSEELGCLPGQSNFPEFSGSGWEEESVHSYSMCPPDIADVEFAGVNTFECLKFTHLGKLKG